MKKFTEYVKASSIWPNAKDFEDLGYKPGLVRGYNVEIVTSDGRVDWMSCCYINEEPDEYFVEDYFYKHWLQDLGYKLTGRICFRGYSREVYDPDDRDTYVIPVEI